MGRGEGAGCYVDQNESHFDERSIEFHASSPGGDPQLQAN